MMKSSIRKHPLRFPLPMSSGIPVLPTQAAQITARPQTSKFYPERLLIKEAAHWQIDAIRVGHRSSALVQNLPGAAFAFDEPGRFPGCGEIEIPSGGELIVEMTYTGPQESGIPFEACVFGSDDQTPPAVCRGAGKKIATVRSESPILPNTTVKLSTDLMDRDAWPCRLVIKETSDWIVNDVCVGEMSIFAQSGDVPGSVFSEDVESACCLGHLSAGDKFSVVATYVGNSEQGTKLEYELYGTHAEYEAVDLPIAVILPMSTGINILPNSSAQLTGRCSRPDGRRRGFGPLQGFVIERIVVERAADWVFNDIKIGCVSQFAQSGDLPALAFSPGAMGGQVYFDVARPGIDIAVLTTYIGLQESGDYFVCGMLGCVVDLADVCGVGDPSMWDAVSWP